MRLSFYIIIEINIQVVAFEDKQLTLASKNLNISET
jgi:hypothetical protein